MDNTFLESNPIHLRRKQFFDARQKEGQSVIEFREELLSLMDKADRANIVVNDLICMMLQIGVSDPALQQELGSIRNPTLPSFNEKIKGYEQARKTTSSTAFGNAASRGNPNRRPPPYAAIPLLFTSGNVSVPNIAINGEVNSNSNSIGVLRHLDSRSLLKVPEPTAGGVNETVVSHCAMTRSVIS